jgi:hypothetical protein
MKVRDGPDNGGKFFDGGGVGEGRVEGWLVPVGEVGSELPHATEITRSATSTPQRTVVFMILRSAMRKKMRFLRNACQGDKRRALAWHATQRCAQPSAFKALAFSPSRFERLFVLGQVLFGEFTATDHLR